MLDIELRNSLLNIFWNTFKFHVPLCMVHKPIQATKIFNSIGVNAYDLFGTKTLLERDAKLKLNFIWR